MTTAARTPTSALQGFLPRAVVAVLAAAAAAAAVHLLFEALGASFLVAPPGQPEIQVTAGMAAAVAAAATGAGALLVGLLRRRVRRPDRLFLGAVAAALLLFGINPFLAADEALTIVALQAEHLAVAAVAVVLLLPPLRTGG